MQVPIPHKHGQNGLKWFVYLFLSPPALMATLFSPGSLKSCPRHCHTNLLMDTTGNPWAPSLALRTICEQGQELWQ